MSPRSAITFEDYDFFELGKFCERLEAFANVEHDYVDGSLVLALNAAFGSGKTTFIEMWSNSLTARRAKGEFCAMPILLNAWDSDHCGEPLLAILAGLVESVGRWKGADAPKNDKLMRAAKEVGWFSTGLANEFVAKWTGLNAVKGEEYVAKKAGANTVVTPDFISMYQQRVAALQDLKAELRDAFGGPQPKVIVFVDELDRCRPDYAVSYLETIKHVFDIEGMVFVLAVDYDQLKGSTMALFGNHLQFEEYFRKFCHRTFQLPVMNENSYRKIAGKYVRQYIRIEGKRISMLDPTHHFEKLVTELVQALALRPRQIQEVFRIIGHTMQTLDSSKEGKILWGYTGACVLLSCFRVGKSELFHQYRKEVDDVGSICSEIVKLLGKENGEWWVKLVIAGSRSHYLPKENIEELIVKLGYADGSPESIRAFSAGFSEAFNHNEKQFLRVANMIEEAQTF